MYPNLYYAIKELFGISIPFLKTINSNGFFMALAFIAGAWLWKYELKRKEKNRELIYITKSITVGKRALIIRILLHLILGFIVGFKLVGLLFTPYEITDNKEYLFSLKGNIPVGFLLGIIWATVTLYVGYVKRLYRPEKKLVAVYPHEYVPKAILVAAISGLIGAKAFSLIENWNAFLDEPIKNLFAYTGFAYPGGFIVATFAMWFYHYKFGAQRMRMADALAPSLMLSYGLGRVGCQIAGDGDWGINNPNPNPYSWLPSWLWSYDYPHNVLRKGLYMQGCTWDDYCNKLAVPVYPTPLYELILCLFLFAILMLIRKRIKMAGRISAIYLMLAAVEWFTIEKIRVKPRYDFWGFHPTQTEVFSVLLFVCGVFLFFIAPKLNANRTANFDRNV